MKYSKARLRLALIPILVLVGCSQVAVNLSEWVPDPATQTFVTEREVISDRKLARHVVVEELRTTVTADDLLKVQFRLRNLTRKQQSVEYRVDWIGDDGMVFVTPTSRWVISHIFSGDSVYVSAISPHESVRRFTVKLKKRK